MIKRELNKLHYCLYLIERKTHLLINKVNPALLLFKIPFIRKKFKNNESVDEPGEWFNDFWLNKETGYGLIFIGGWLVTIIFLFLFSSVKIIFDLININELFNAFYFIVFAILSYIICYFTVFKENRYLSYFDTFKYWSLRKKRINVLYSILFIIGVITLFFGSLILF